MHPQASACTTECDNVVSVELQQTGDATIRPADNPATLNPPRPTPPVDGGS